MNKNLLLRMVHLFSVMPLLFSVFTPFSFVEAQSNPTSPKIELPSVAVNSLLMQEYLYTPGKNVQMTLDIENISNSPSEFRYKVEILPTDESLLATSSAQVILSASKLSERYVLRPKETKSINISYPIPSYAKGTVVLKVSAINDAGFEVYSKTLSLLDSNQENMKSVVGATSTGKQNSKKIEISNYINIKRVSFQQGNNIFEPKGDGSSYLLDETVDLDIDVTTEGSVSQNALVLAEIRNIHTGSSTEVVQGIESKGVSKIRLRAKTTSLPAGVYELILTPISPDKTALGPSRKINIGIEGIVAVIQSLQVNANLPVRKGDPIYLSAYWVPIMQISKELTEDLIADSKFSKPFTAKIFIEDETGVQISSSTINGATPEISTTLTAQNSAKNVFGKIEIYIENDLIGSYKKELLLEPLTTKKSASLSWKSILVASLILLVVIALSIFLKKKKISVRSVMTFTLIFLVSFPQVTTAQWTQFSTNTSLVNRYPKNLYGDYTTTLWGQMNVSYGGYHPNWPAIVPYSRNGCTARTAATGAASNYVTQTLPLISGNNKMHRWEQSWQKVTQGGSIWYWVNKNTYANGTTWPYNASVIPGVFSKSAFINETLLDRSAAFTDDLTTGDGEWDDRRPIRLNTTPHGMGTNMVSALATTTYSNLIQWVNAWFNVEESRTDFGSNEYFKYFASDAEESMEKLGLWGSDTAVPLEQFVDDFQFGFTSSNLSTRKTALGVTSNSDTIFNVDAGAFSKDIFAFESYRLGSPYRIEQESLPGTYRLFNFLYTARDENPVTVVSGTPQYDCISGNLQVWQNNYEVIGNSYVDVTIFFDENADGLKQDTEYTISNQPTSIDGGMPLRTYSGGVYNTVCAVATQNENQYAPHFYSGTADKPVHYYNAGKNSSNADYGKYFGIYMRSVGQVTNPTFLNSSYINTNMVINLGWNNSDKIHTVYDWVNRGYSGSTQVKYDSQGRLIFSPGYSSQVCGQRITSYATPIGLDRAYELEVRDYPAPGTIANDHTVYWKMPVNSEVSSQYVVSVDESLLPTGWSTTTPPVTINTASTTSAGSQNQHYVVFQGVTYVGNGVCGSATTTLSAGPAPFPETNLCSGGQNTWVAPEIQRYTWSCLGINGGSDAFCSKQKCPGTQYYCEATNACVVDIGACSVAGACGYADQAEGQQTNEYSAPIIPTTQLCNAGIASLVAGEGDPYPVYTWTCAGQNGGQSSPTCDQPKCGDGLQYCATLNECRTACPVTSTSTLIYDASLSPKIVRKRSDQCTFSWKTSASEETPVSCTLNGASLGGPSPDVQRSTLVPVGIHNLSCTNDAQDQSTTTRCQLSPNFIEI